MSKPKMLLTDARRARVVVILDSMGAEVSVSVKARKIEKCLGEPCTYGQALSLLSQFRKGNPRRRKSWAQVNQERFERIQARGKRSY